MRNSAGRTIVEIVILAIVASLAGIYGWVLLALGLYYGKSDAKPKTYLAVTAGVLFIEFLLLFLFEVATSAMPLVSLVSSLGVEVFGAVLIFLFLILYAFSIIFTYASVRVGRRL